MVTFVNKKKSKYVNYALGIDKYKSLTGLNLFCLAIFLISNVGDVISKPSRRVDSVERRQNMIMCTTSAH